MLHVLTFGFRLIWKLSCCFKNCVFCNIGILKLKMRKQEIIHLLLRPVHTDLSYSFQRWEWWCQDVTSEMQFFFYKLSFKKQTKTLFFFSFFTVLTFFFFPFALIAERWFSPCWKGVTGFCGLSKHRKQLGRTLETFYTIMTVYSSAS